MGLGGMVSQTSQRNNVSKSPFFPPYNSLGISAEEETQARHSLPSQSYRGSKQSRYYHLDGVFLRMDLTVSKHLKVAKLKVLFYLSMFIDRALLLVDDCFDDG